MIQGFRKLFSSRLGVIVTLAFVGLMALAFASADITGSSFGGVGGGERVASVGDEQISTSSYAETLNGAFEQARQERPGLTMAQFLAGGGRDGVLDNMVERLAVFAFARDNGLRIGDALIGSELKQIPAFLGLDGKFSQDNYDAALRQRGLSDALVRKDIGQGLAARMTLIPAQIGTTMPTKVAAQYARLLNETRRGSIGVVPSAAFAADVRVTDAILQSYLASNRKRYSLPERRTIQYAVIDAAGLGNVAATDAEIAARYQQDRAKYAGKEGRTLTQLVVPTEAAAKALLAEIGTPARMDAVARAKGLSTAKITAADRAELAAQTSPALTQAAFDTAQGAIAGPVKGPLGWYLLRVDAATRTAERPLAQVRGEIADALTAQKRSAALADRAAKAEDELGRGASLADVAKSLGAQVRTTGPLLANGRPFGPGAAPDAEIARMIPAAFAMEEDGDAQIAVAADGQSYILFAPGQVTPSAPPAFAQIKPLLERDYRLQEGSKLASAAADKVLAAIAKGQSPTEAFKLVGRPVPAVDTINTNRQALLASGQQTPPALALLFSMARSSTKKLAAPDNMGWIIVDLDDIVTRDVPANDPLLVATRRQLGPQIGGELGEQLTRAIVADVGVKRNDKAIKAVVDQLVGNR